MENLLTKLTTSKKFEGVRFEAGTAFCWSPKTKTINYDANKKDDPVLLWSLLHEAGHAGLKHTDYSSDLELLLLEVAAWEEAKRLGQKYSVTVDEEHIQDCLDTYRDWLHQRSTCPRCGLASLQESIRKYRCHNCNCTWVVSVSRFCRPYRLTKTSETNKKITGQTTFN